MKRYQLSNSIKRIYPDEPIAINKKEKIAKFQVSTPIFVIGLKDRAILDDKSSKSKTLNTEIESSQNKNIDDNTVDNDIVKRYLSISIILNMLVNDSSDFYQRMYKEGLLTDSLDFSYEWSLSYAHIILEGQSKSPKKVFEEFKNEVKKFGEELEICYMNNGNSGEKFKEKAINLNLSGLDKIADYSDEKIKEGIRLFEKSFNRTKKRMYGEMAQDFNSVGEIARMFLQDSLKDVNSFEFFEKIMDISLKDVYNIYKEIFNEDNMIISIVEK